MIAHDHPHKPLPGIRIWPWPSYIDLQVKERSIFQFGHKKSNSTLFERSWCQLFNNTKIFDLDLISKRPRSIKGFSYVRFWVIIYKINFPGPNFQCIEFLFHMMIGHVKAHKPIPGIGKWPWPSWVPTKVKSANCPE